MLRDDVLAALERARGQIVSGEQLANEFNVSRAAIWKAIDRLRKEKIEIIAEKGGGYRLHLTDDSLTAVGVQSLLQTEIFGKAMTIVPQIGSTNTAMKQDFAHTMPHGFVLSAEAQTEGRGRMGRSFASPVGSGLYFSILLKPDLPLDKLHFLTLTAAIAVCQSIEACCGFHPSIKWVNDVLMQGRKLCGILTEASIEGESGKIEYAVVGIGINLRFSAENHPELANIAAGLYDFCENPPRRAVLLADILHKFELQYHALQNGDFLPILDSYRNYLCCLQQEIDVHQGDSVWQATALDVNPAGHLVVRDQQGQLHSLSSGEIRIRLK